MLFLFWKKKKGGGSIKTACGVREYESDVKSKKIRNDQLKIEGNESE